MRNIPPLNALRAFEAAARHESVQNAALELNVTPSAVSHQLKALEGYMGVVMFHRFNRRIVLTEAGQDYLQSVGSVFDRIEGATRHIIDGRVSDLLTVHCKPSFAPAWLVPRIEAFRRLHPEIELRIHATPEPPDFFRSDTDVEIRQGEGDWPGLVSVKIVDERISPLMSPSLRATLPDELEPEHIQRAPLIHSERAPIGWHEWFRKFGVTLGTRLPGLRFDRGYLSIQAAEMGLGVALESLVYAERELRAGTLVEVPFPQPPNTDFGAHILVFPEVYREIPKIKMFSEWIQNIA